MQKDQANQSSESDKVYNEQEDEQESRLEKCFINDCQETRQANQINKPNFSQQIRSPIEMMFILYSFYKEDITSIGIQYCCKVRISLDKIKISSDNLAQDVQACNADIQKYLNKISYEPLGHQNRQKILYSPYFKQKAQEKSYRLCKFNSIIYCHSNRMNKQALKNSMKQLFSGQYLFTVDIKYRKAKDLQIDKYLIDFIKKMKAYNSQQFKDRQVVVQIDNTQTRINCIGIKQRDLVAVKNMMKNLLQSTVILIIKFENPQQMETKVQSLKAYVKKITEFPVSVAKIEKRALTMISKQNIIRKLLAKSKVLQILRLNDKTQLGFYLPKRRSFRTRKTMIEDLCTKKGYDFTTLGGFYHYFKKMFIHEGQVVDPKQVLELIQQVLQNIKQSKEKFDIPQQIKNKQMKEQQLQVMQGQYYSAGDVTQDNTVSIILKRNVLRQKLKMSKPMFVKYKICESPESQTVYWYINNKGQKILCNIQEMNLGTQYFSGKFKKLGNQMYYLYEYKLIIT